MKWVLLFLISLPGTTGFGQYITKKWFDRSDSVYGFYISIPPASGRVQGVLVLLDGYGANAEGFLAETRIHNVAWANDILTIGIPTGTRLYLDPSMTELLNRVLKETLQTYGLQKDRVAIGGMSSGGTIALRYAELCNENPAGFPARPKAVFAIDSPVDLVGLYRSSERDLKKNNKGWWLGESQMIIDQFKNELGDPSKDLTKYREVSPLLREGKDSLNEKALVDVAVRTYHDVDINWYIQNRKRSLYETNIADGSELISRLVSSGSQQAEFIVSKLPGRRSDGQRHPHSWNIADETDLVQWLKTSLHFYPDHLAVPFSYTAPEAWGRETILFPIDFAPGLPYKGFEELRFAPGWGDSLSHEKWAYTILWWLAGTHDFNEKLLKQNIEEYFTGLTKRRAVADKLDMKLFKPASAQVQKVAAEKGDRATFRADVSIFDAQVARKPGWLYIKVHLKQCGEENRTLVLFEIAGHTFSEKVWESLDRINVNFSCTKIIKQ